MGVGWKGKVGAVHAGSRIGWEKGGEERREEASFGSGGERRGRASERAGGRLRRGAWACALKSRLVLGPGVWRRFKKEKNLLLSQSHATSSIFL